MKSKSRSRIHKKTRRTKNDGELEALEKATADLVAVAKKLNPLSEESIREVQAVALKYAGARLVFEGKPFGADMSNVDSFLRVLASFTVRRWD